LILGDLVQFRNAVEISLSIGTIGGSYYKDSEKLEAGISYGEFCLCCTSFRHLYRFLHIVVLRNFVEIDDAYERKVLEITCMVADISDQRPKDGLKDGLLIQPMRGTGRMLLAIGKCIMFVDIL
jgi:hypothetical protein